MHNTHCPECGARFQADPRLAGVAVRCPNCGKPFKVAAGQPDDEVIDVRAQVLNESQDGATAEPVWTSPATEVETQRTGAGNAPGGFTWVFERRTQGGPGCCSCGCLLLIAFIALALQGFFSLFS